MIKAVVFDMDGTLLDSMHVWDHVGETYLAGLGIQAEEYLCDRLAAMSLTQGAQYMKETYDLDVCVEDIMKGIEDIVLYEYQEHLQLKEGVKDCLWRCKKRGLKLCVLSASSEEMVTSALRRCGILDDFLFIMTCERAGCAKDDLKIYEMALKRLDVHHEECVFVDDALYAISCMKQAGLMVYAVYDEANKNDWERICDTADQSFMSLSEWR